MMKIIVNATPLLNIPTGIGRYIKALYTEIRLQHPEFEIKYFDGTSLSDVLPNPPEDKGFWTFAVNLAWRLPYFFPYLARIFIHKKREQAFFKLSKGFDIYHEAGFFPFKAEKHVKIIFTVHDISLKALPDFHPKDRVLFFRKYFEQSLRYTDAVITPSRFTETEIRKIYPAITASTHPIALGFDKTLFFKRPETEVKALKLKLKLPEKYILFVGTSDPRKNIKAIAQAMAHLPESVVLVCAGWSGWGSMKGLKQSLSDIKKRILFTGYMADQELAALYSGARVFVYPSFYEGFGLPVLEAMACGCPVVCANTASLPEVAGDAALTCDPMDPRCLADAIYQIFTSDALYAEMCLKSLVQAQKFSWAEAADKTIHVFAGALLHSSIGV